MKKLYRNMKDRQISGVCAGLSDFFNIDVTIVRVLFVVFAFLGIGLLTYLIMALIVPKK